MIFVGANPLWLPRLKGVWKSSLFSICHWWQFQSLFTSACCRESHQGQPQGIAPTISIFLVGAILYGCPGGGIKTSAFV